MNKLTVTIGIPAYNEEDNINLLLDSVFLQKSKHYSIDKIIVVSDGSTDKTLGILRKYKGITILLNKKRIGQQRSQNKMLDICSSDVFVLLEADTVIESADTLDNLIIAFIHNKDKKIGMLAGMPNVINPKNFFESILFHGYKIKRQLFSKIRNGENVYSSGGHSIRLIPSSTISWFRWKENLPEDSYLYLSIKARGYKLLLVKNANTIKRNVTNIKDRSKQCNKYQGGVRALKKIFGERFVQNEYYIKPSLIMINSFSYFLKEPFWTVAYLIEVISNRIFTYFNKEEFNDLSNPYESSKVLKRSITFSNYDEPKNPYYGGGGALSNQKIAAFLSKNYKVQILCGKYPNSKDYSCDGVNYKHVGLSLGGPLLGQVVFYLILPWYALFSKSDLWLETFIPPCSVGFIPLFFKGKVIGVTSLLNAEFFSKKYKLPFHFVERFGLKYYKNIIALNEESKVYIKKYSPLTDVIVIPRGVSEDYFKIKRGNKYNILFLGRFDIFQKGLDLLIKSWINVVEKQRKAKLYIYGKGTENDERQLEDLINREKLNKNIFVEGWVEGKEKMKEIKSSEIVVCPSRFEGFNNTALEALASGRCVICYDIDGLKWIKDDIAKKVKPYDSVLFSKEIIEIITNEKERKVLSVNARKFAKKYSWQNVIAIYQNLIEMLLRNNININ